jgi:hypothetical protein
MSAGPGKVGTCAICGETKPLLFGHFSESYKSNPGHEWLICKDCANIRFLCEICEEQTTSLSYERHLKLKHTREQLAKKISDDKTENIGV